MKIVTRSMLVSTLMIAQIAGSGAALADREDIAMLAEAKISLIDAIKAAEKHQGGQAVDASLDDDSFRPAYEVSVVKDNRTFDVQVDAVSGDVLGAREDHDD